MESVERNISGLPQASTPPSTFGRQAGDDDQKSSMTEGSPSHDRFSGKKPRFKKKTPAEKANAQLTPRKGEPDTEESSHIGQYGMGQYGSDGQDRTMNPKIEKMLSQILDKVKAIEKNQDILARKMIQPTNSRDPEGNDNSGKAGLRRFETTESRRAEKKKEKTIFRRTEKQAAEKQAMINEEAQVEKFPEQTNNDSQDDSTSSLNEKTMDGPRAPTLKEDGCFRVTDYWCERMLNNRNFDRVVGILILGNCIEIGWSIETELQGKSVTASKVFESLFLVIFIIELMIRVGGSRQSWTATFMNRWLQCDIIIISIGCLCSWIIEPILESCTGDCRTSQTMERWVQTGTVFRLFRLFRFLRALRFFRTFKTLWKLANGLVQSMGTIMWTLCLIVFILYVFACLCIEVITRDPKLKTNLEGTIEKHYSSIPLTMFSLVGFVTLDNASDLYWDLVMEKNELVLLFIPLLLVVSIALVNLVTAVLVENAIESAKLDKEYQRELMRQRVQAVRPEIEEAFHFIDTSGDGEADLGEVMAAYQELPAVITEQVHEESLAGVFEILDFNGSGTISKDEFVEGILQLTLSDQPLETKQMLKALSFIRELLQELRVEIFKVLPAKKESKVQQQ